MPRSHNWIERKLVGQNAGSWVESMVCVLCAVCVSDGCQAIRQRMYNCVHWIMQISFSHRSCGCRSCSASVFFSWLSVVCVTYTASATNLERGFVCFSWHFSIVSLHFLSFFLSRVCSFVLTAYFALTVKSKYRLRFAFLMKRFNSHCFILFFASTMCLATFHMLNIWKFLVRIHIQLLCIVRFCGKRMPKWVQTQEKIGAENRKKVPRRFRFSHFIAHIIR